MSSLISFIFLFLFSSITASAQNTFYLYHNCSVTTTFSSNSTYSTNLKTLLSSLSSLNASSYSTGFQTATAGQAPDRVTGLFLCRVDVSSEVCRSCVTFAVNETLTRCPKDKEGVFYYEQCLLRYSNRNIVATLNTDGGMFMQSARNPLSVKQDQFRDLVLTPMNLAAVEAARSFKNGL
ncbi:putative cysteine-rich receptor-like protein kinase 20 [Arabidopsis thaliana]